MYTWHVHRRVCGDQERAVGTPISGVTDICILPHFAVHPIQVLCKNNKCS